MNLFNYLESRFTQLSLEGQKEFNLLKDCELKAVMAVMKGLRSFLKWIMVINVLGRATLIMLHVINAPATSKELIEASMVKPSEPKK